MKVVNLSILSLFLLTGIKQANAQTRKVAIEHKEFAPIKEAEVKETPHIEAIAPQPMQHTEFLPAKEPEVRNEIQTEITGPTVPVEEHKAEPVEQVEWVKTTPEPVKPTVATTNTQNNTAPAQPAFKMPVYNGQTRPAMKRVSMKPLVIGKTKEQ